ncbi:beta-fructofuranosidase, insoluble isoenzyme CWINV3 [Lactuca sativa]|uniref:beta-fructofuranosidase, insoluble isoenzyme CWINV3 n=1 Tax=Lactuca sativa TaxID=4236 RepID=UPI000CD8D536|nr:beta-fructofuranosidase, insoluble isoenzyme CWINV3 [Lactuca sativa]
MSIPSSSTSESPIAAVLEQPYRTGFHFQPPQNWMNDPNGQMWYNGVYHFFYQHNPFGPLFDIRMHWGHSVSYDLINWIHLDPAFAPTEPFDINGCWSGSATILPGNKPIMLYTGRDTQERQVQNLAVPKDLSDPYLKEWVKDAGNPVINLPEGIQSDDFRDPTTAWIEEDGKWRLLVGSKRDRTGIAFLYHSDDLVNWVKYDTPLHQAPETGIWECPDYFPVWFDSTMGVDTSVVNPSKEVKHVLKVSLIDRFHDYYMIGKYSPEEEHYVPENDDLTQISGLRLDYGRFYASKSFFDPVKIRRITMAWVHETDSDADFIARGWAGVQSFPRSIWLDKNQKQLLQWPIEEIETLYGNQVSFQNKKLEGLREIEGSFQNKKREGLHEIEGITASQADVKISFKFDNLEEAEELDPSLVDPKLICAKYHATKQGKFGPFGLLALASNDLTEQTAIYFRIFKKNGRYVVVMCSDQSQSSKKEKEESDKTFYGAFLDIDPQQDEISLRTLIDHSIVESFGGGGKSCITSRVYPTLAIGKDAKLFAFNYGTKSVMISEMNAWSVKSAQMSIEESNV